MSFLGSTRIDWGDPEIQNSSSESTVKPKTVCGDNHLATMLFKHVIVGEFLVESQFVRKTDYTSFGRLDHACCYHAYAMDKWLTETFGSEWDRWHMNVSSFGRPCGYSEELEFISKRTSDTSVIAYLRLSAIRFCIFLKEDEDFLIFSLKWL